MAKSKKSPRKTDIAVLEEKDLFLCHNRADKPWARTLGARIEQETWNGRTLRVFLDQWDIDVGDNFLGKINDGLSRSRFVALLMSPEMLASAWCRLETTATLAADPMNEKGRLLPLLVRDTSIRGERIALPPILAPFHYLPFGPTDYEASYEALISKLRCEKRVRR